MLLLLLLVLRLEQKVDLLPVLVEEVHIEVPAIRTDMEPYLIPFPSPMFKVRLTIS